MSDKIKSVPSVSVTYARNGASTRANALGMRPMQERAYEKRGEQYLLIKSPPASGKSRALNRQHHDAGSSSLRRHRDERRIRRLVFDLAPRTDPLVRRIIAL